jgi:hypothetical protein
MCAFGLMAAKLLLQVKFNNGNGLCKLDLFVLFVKVHLAFDFFVLATLLSPSLYFYFAKKS